MDPRNAEQLRAIFDEAAERPEGERAEFVHSASGGDVELEREVSSLLAALTTQSGALETDSGTWLVDAVAGEGGQTSQLGQESDAILPTQLRGEIVGDFRLLREIGRGGIGSVYEAEQISVKRRVAVKLLQSWTASRESRRRFIEESATLAKLTHPGIAHVIAAGTRTLDLSGPDHALAEGIFSDLHSVPWIAMELVEGASTILDWSRGQPPQQVVRILASVCDALHHGHQQGIIHRDIKPANILVNERGEPKIIDFGIARAIGTNAATASSDTMTGTLLGSPRYMSPEQCEGCGNAVDTRSDVYSLGVVLYEALTAAMPYAVDDTAIAACMLAICQSQAADPRGAMPTLSKDIAAVLLKALRKSPAERYQSASDFAADLRRVLNQEPVMARATPWPHRVILLIRRRPVVSLLGLVAMLGVIAGVVGITIGLANERVARRAADREAWLANLTAADSYLRDGNGGMARRRLDAIPESRRGWEWHLLYAKSDTSSESWRITDVKGRTFISPSGKTVLFRDQDTLRADVYDVATRTRLCSFEGINSDGAPGWSPDERRIAFAKGIELVIADTQSGEVLRRIHMLAGSEHIGGFAIAPGWSPDGTLIATGTTMHYGVMAFKVDTGECVFKREGNGWTFSVAFSPNGRTLAWCGERGVEIVDTKSWTNIHTIPVPRAAQLEQGWLAFSPDGLTLALGYGRDGYLIDPIAGSIRTVLRGHAQRIHSVTLDNGGARLLTTSIDRTVRTWNVADGSPGPVLLGHESPTWAASSIKGAHPREKSVVSVDVENRVRWWFPDSGTPVYSTTMNECTNHITQLDFTPGQSVLAVVGLNAYAEISLKPTPRLSHERSIEMGTPRPVLASRMLIRQSSSSEIIAERLETGEHIWSASCEPFRGEFFVSPNAELVAVSQRANILLFDARSGQQRGICNTGHPAHGAVFTDDGTLLVTKSFEGEINVWDTKSGTLVEQFAPSSDRGSGLAWNADASWIAYCHATDGITIWDRNARKVITRIDNVGGYVWSLALSPDGKRLAVGAQDRICHIYDIPSGDEVLQLRDHVGTVMSVAWSPDGQSLATGGYDRRVFVYQVSSDLGQTSSVKVKSNN